MNKATLFERLSFNVWEVDNGVEDLEWWFLQENNIPDSLKEEGLSVMKRADLSASDVYRVNQI